MAAKLPYVVTVELPRQEIPCHGRDESDAVLTAWHMLGVAGLQHFGTVTVSPRTGSAA